MQNYSKTIYRIGQKWCCNGLVMSAVVWYELWARAPCISTLHCWVGWLLNFCGSVVQVTGSEELLAWLSAWLLVFHRKEYKLFSNDGCQSFLP